MIQPVQLLPLLTTLLSIGVLAYAAVDGNETLLAATAVLIAALTSDLGGGWRVFVLMSYPVAFLTMLLIHQEPLRPEGFLVAMLVMSGLLLMLYRDTLHKKDLLWDQQVMQALQSGSRALARSQTPQGAMEAGVAMIDSLKLTSSVAYVSYREGTPRIFAARGAFKPYLDCPIFPGHNDSRSVQADHWVTEETLRLLPRSERVSFLAIPVSNRDTEHKGTFLLANDEEIDISEEHRKILEALARLVGAQLGQFEMIEELEVARDMSLRALGATLERRDDETGGHTTRVVELSLRLGEAVGFSEEQLRSLRWGAYLHDLGKIAIPDAILHKPGRLDDEERKIMESHAMSGYELLQHLNFLPRETLDVVRHHHEKWNGRGYPGRLRGPEIPSSARIFSIVDVYDALTSERPYKVAWSMNRALEEIELNAGEHFDPQYAKAFVRMMREENPHVFEDEQALVES